MIDSAPAAGSEIPKPLTRLNTSGEVYLRHAAAERQLREILPQGRAAIFERLNVASRADERFLLEETLVYLMREAKLINDLEMYEAATTMLYRRAERAVKRRLRGAVDNEDAAIEAAANVLAEVFLAIDDVSSNKADYAQVRFNHLVKRIVNKYAALARKQLAQDRLADSIDEEINDEQTAPFEIGDFHPQLDYEDREFIEKALNALSADVRTAFRMKHYYGWKIESDDAHEPTISKYFGKTEKTIRNWLREADGQLRVWREKGQNR